MDFRHILRVFFTALGICAYGISIFGSIESIKAFRELKKQEESEIIKKETLLEYNRGNRLIQIGLIPGTIFAVITMLFYYNII